ncbi:hypothetical protein EYF80_040219 [Liparis tanakae]|uniref:Uncharacterized protein n=1 Tax=Liparis tanakae TaxID=230148 RepID=A0A4Z2G8L3_9TELE|nr:hypothetical protein EYF80_040219 [Liparis tanakae]
MDIEYDNRVFVPELAFDPLGQVVAHLDGEVLAVQRLHLVQGLALQLLGLDPHGHGAPVEAGGRRKEGRKEQKTRGVIRRWTSKRKGDKRRRWGRSWGVGKTCHGGLKGDFQTEKRGNHEIIQTRILQRNVFPLITFGRGSGRRSGWGQDRGQDGGQDRVRTGVRGLDRGQTGVRTGVRGQYGGQNGVRTGVRTGVRMGVRGQDGIQDRGQDRGQDGGHDGVRTGERGQDWGQDRGSERRSLDTCGEIAELKKPGAETFWRFSQDEWPLPGRGAAALSCGRTDTAVPLSPTRRRCSHNTMDDTTLHLSRAGASSLSSSSSSSASSSSPPPFIISISTSTTSSSTSTSTPSKASRSWDTSTISVPWTTSAMPSRTFLTWKVKGGTLYDAVWDRAFSLVFALVLSIFSLEKTVFRVCTRCRLLRLMRSARVSSKISSISTPSSSDERSMWGMSAFSASPPSSSSTASLSSSMLPPLLPETASETFMDLETLSFEATFTSSCGEENTMMVNALYLGPTVFRGDVLSDASHGLVFLTVFRGDVLSDASHGLVFLLKLTLSSHWDPLEVHVEADVALREILTTFLM